MRLTTHRSVARSAGSRRSILAQAHVKLRPRMMAATVRTERLCDRLGNQIETLLVGLDAGRKFFVRDRARNHQYAHAAPIPAGAKEFRATTTRSRLYGSERPDQGERRAHVRAKAGDGFDPQWIPFSDKNMRKKMDLRHHVTVWLAPASRVIASIIAAGLAMPLPAISNALPWATEENNIGLPIAKAADWLKARSFAGM
jgi:hypothetical protein